MEHLFHSYVTVITRLGNTTIHGFLPLETLERPSHCCGLLAICGVEGASVATTLRSGDVAVAAVAVGATGLRRGERSASRETLMYLARG